MVFKVPPPREKPPVDLVKLAEFAAGAEVLPEQAVEPQDKPSVASKKVKATPAKDKPQTLNWDSFDDKRRHPAFVMRFTELELAKLKRIADTTPHSMHEFCLRAIRKSLDETKIDMDTTLDSAP